MTGEPSIVGKWKTDGLPAGHGATFEFKEGGRYTLAKKTPKGGGGTSGSWKLSKDRKYLSLGGKKREILQLTAEKMVLKEKEKSGTVKDTILLRVKRY